ncbi:MAG: Lrp/AsnC family transcriptional regulator [Candidatus Bathyarchaeota archaeon]|nr:Lrp/AsnC family transcriptional regulator [Candidatus Bathyarchaeota archaeon]MDH5746903.1 Lrp/AsnC family transcriptional regulator [Candidatus Bathyarchaeota archaeon]
MRSLEKEGAIKTYDAVFDYKKINERFCAFILVSSSLREHPDPGNVAEVLARHKEVESIDLVTEEWGLVIRVRTKDQDQYFNFLRNVLSRKGIQRTVSLTSLKQVKNEFSLL